MSHTALPALKKTHTRGSRDLGRERWNVERERAAIQMHRERRRRQSGQLAVPPGDILAETEPGDNDLPRHCGTHRP